MSSVFAVVVLQQLPALPSLWVNVGLMCCLALAGLLLWRMPSLGFVLVPVLVVGMTVIWVSFLAQQRLAQALPAADENRVSRITFEVVGLPQYRAGGVSFIARVQDSQPAGVPHTLQVTWPAPTWAGPYTRPVPYHFPTILPGQVWRSNMLVKTPHGYSNTHGFDYEQYLFGQGVRAVASIRGQPQLVVTKPGWQRSWAVMAQRLRYELRAAMQPYVQSYRYGGVILALSMGDQQSIENHDWQVFNRTGLTHLVSISGSHVTLMAVLAAACVSWCWRRLRCGRVRLAEYWPTHKVTACVALLVAAWYCTVAGWGVPAQRTFLMLAVVVCGRLGNVSWQPSQTLAVAAVLVVWFDPWAVLASGFWLSFGAVAVLLLCYHWQGHAMRSYKGWRALLYVIGKAAAWQLVISVALFPALAWQFAEISLISPLSNAYAIPLIGMVITPLSLLLMVTAPIAWLAPLSEGVAWLAHALVALMMRPTQWLSELPAASLAVAAAPAWAYVVAIVGMAYALLPKGLPGRQWGWVGVLPCLLWGKEQVAEGEWLAHVLDIGQGNAIVVQTRRHTLLFDTGLRTGYHSDMGERVILPFLRATGITALDWLVLSHDDLDHSGGAWSVLQSLPVQTLYASFDVNSYLQRESVLLNRPSPLSGNTARKMCQQGVSWQVDGVQFSFLWPTEAALKYSDSNARSCVLSVRSAHGKGLLLMGDIGVAQEASILRQGVAPHEVVVVGHHGSRTSSSIQWVRTMQATWAIAQVGWWNRFGHPHPEVQKRWQQQHAVFIRTDYAGAVRVQTEGETLSVQCQRQRRARYWQHPNAGLQLPCANRGR